MRCKTVTKPMNPTDMIRTTCKNKERERERKKNVSHVPPKQNMRRDGYVYQTNTKAQDQRSDGKSRRVVHIKAVEAVLLLICALRSSLPGSAFTRAHTDSPYHSPP